MSGEKIGRTVDVKKKERTRLRLVIAIPALMILISLTAGILSYEIVMDVVDHVDLYPVRRYLEKTAN
jgi:TRAP-type C4-dicarboxylate transport system permease small subunit